MLAVLFALLPVASTFLGGYAVFRFHHRLHPVMAFAAGIIVATALVDLLPEALQLLGGPDPTLKAGVAALVGFLGFSAIEALVHRETYEHGHAAGQDPQEPHEHVPAGREPSAISMAGPFGLVLHSGLDGVAIGLGFSAGPEVGLIVGLAVLAHDFADGINITTLTLAGGGGRRLTLTILAMDAVAAPIGAVIGISSVSRPRCWACCWPRTPACSSPSAPATCCPRRSTSGRCRRRHSSSWPASARSWSSSSACSSSRIPRPRERAAVRRDERVRLSVVGAALLPGRGPRGGAPALLRLEASGLRAERHVLSTAERRDRDGLGRRHAAGLPVHRQGPARGRDAGAGDRPGGHPALAARAVPCPG